MPRSSPAPAAQLGILAAAFVLGTLVAKVAGADWGPASAFGQMAFAAALVTILLRTA